MTDIVNYAIPLDPFSSLMNKFLAEKKSEEIFEYRKEVLAELFADS